MSNTSQAGKKSIFGGNVRWAICGLLFFASTVNYMDRQVLGLLKPTLEKELGWNDKDFGWIIFTFQLAYAIVMPFAGRAIDWLGTRVGYAVAVIIWSLASMSHSIAGTPIQFAMARFGLGFGEAANFPAALRTVAEWFPKRERAFATGLFNSGTNIGALIVPILVPFVALHFGWRKAFLVTGGLDFVWLALWLSFYRKPSEHPGVTAAELQLIESDGVDRPKGPAPSYFSLLGKKGAWAYLVGKFMTDPVWWFYLYWVPGFLHDNYGLDLAQSRLPLVVIYLVTDVGSIGGGYLSKMLISLGLPHWKARKTAMLICALLVTPVGLIMYTGSNLWATVGLISLAAAAHQGWSANLFTIPSDTFHKEAVGSVAGFGGMGGAFGGMLVAPAIGWWLDYSHKSYGPIFIAAGSAYLIALTVIHLLLPKVARVEEAA